MNNDDKKVKVSDRVWRRLFIIYSVFCLAFMALLAITRLIQWLDAMIYCGPC